MVVVDVTFDDWNEVDPWWDAYTDSTSLSLYSESDVSLDTDLSGPEWVQIDAWWEPYRDNHSFGEFAERGGVVGNQWFDGAWEGLGPWWDEYVVIQQEAISDLRELFSAVEEQ